MTASLRLSPFVLAMLAACSSTDSGTATEAASTGAGTTSATSSETSDETSTATGNTATGSTGSTGEAPTTGGAAELTYYRDIKPILDRKCATCHRPGDIGPFALTTYDETQKLAVAIAGSVEDGTTGPTPRTATRPPSASPPASARSSTT